MDRIDKKIITLLQKNARMPLKALAEQVFLSSPAVSARIERLEKEQIISGYEAKVNPFKLGYHITAFINLDVMPTQKPEFYPFVKACPNVVECNCVTGDFSMLLKVMFPSTQELDTFIGQLSDEDLMCLMRGEGMCSMKVTPGTAAAYGGLTPSLERFGIPAL